MKKFRNYFIEHQQTHSFFIILFISGICTGVLLSSYLSSTDISDLSMYLTTIPSEGFDNLNYFNTQVCLNSLFLIVIALLGYSFFALPILAFIVFTKGVQIGFSCAIFIFAFQIKGLLGIIMTLFPQIVFDIISFGLVATIALECSFLIIKCSLDTEKFPLKNAINITLTTLIISLFIILISTYFKSTLLISFLSLFNMI